MSAFTCRLCGASPEDEVAQELHLLGHSIAELAETRRAPTAQAQPPTPAWPMRYLAFERAWLGGELSFILKLPPEHLARVEWLAIDGVVGVGAIVEVSVGLHKLVLPPEPFVYAASLLKRTGERGAGMRMPTCTHEEPLVVRVSSFKDPIVVFGWGVVSDPESRARQAHALKQMLHPYFADPSPERAP